MCLTSFISQIYLLPHATPNADKNLINKDDFDLKVRMYNMILKT